MQPRRQTRELPPIGEVRDTTVAIEGIAVIATGGAIEIRVDGQIIQVTSEQAWAMASALLELYRLTSR